MNRIKFFRLKDSAIKTILFAFILWISAFFCLQAQEKPAINLPANDTVSLSLNDSIPGKDSLLLASNTVPAAYKVTYSKDSLDATVEYNATGSIVYDFTHKKVFLHDNASVNYKTISLKADYIELDWENNIVNAEGKLDSAGHMAGFPEFKDGDQSFNAKKMQYNFKTRKGIVFDVKTTQGDIVVLGSKSKFISDPNPDTSKARDIVYSEDAIFTTCTDEHPHFGIRSTRQKVIPNKLVVIGPSNLEIMGVPTPLWLPFGFFPVASGRRTGLLFPSDYQFSPALGFGLREIGWFFPLGEHFNLSVTGDIYLKGTWGINARSQYSKRYKYNGSFFMGYNRQRLENAAGEITPNPSFIFRWSHQQASTAHPSSQFGGSINIQSNNFQSRVYNDANSVLQNQLSSNLTFSKNWQGTPFSMNSSFTHNQNTATRNVSISFPNFQFKTQTIYPFKSKTSGKKGVFNNINFRYTNDVRNQFDATDTTLFDRKTLEDARFGIKHDISGGTSSKVFKYFNLAPSFSYREVWYLNSINRDVIQNERYNSVTTVNSENTEFQTVTDTILTDSLVNNRINGFNRFYQMSASVSLNTQIFGTMTFKKGFLRGLRHVIKPSIGMTFAPDYLNPGRGWFDFVESPSNPDLLTRYSIFEGGIFGAPSASGRQMALTYGINNIFEAKIFSKKDSTEKKIPLFNNINIGGSYNFAADSLKWSQVNLSGTARFFKGATTLSIRALFDPYIVSEKGQRLNVTSWKANGSLVRFVDAAASFTTSLTVDKIRAIFQGKEEEIVEDVRERTSTRSRETTDFLSLFENFSINHNFILRREKSRPGVDTFYVSTHAIDIQGSIRLTDNWDIRIGRIGYDFVRQNITFPSVGFSRDLHCWEMGMDWQPTRGTYRFYIQVKPGTLDFLKIPYQRNNIDALNAF